MKQGIHPEYKETTVSCACGNVIETRATKENIKVEICASCHPYFTGKHKLLDTEGRVERFINKYKKK
ncbi:MAG: 50S ribosomal protein L31 [Bdellovibrionales bacterium RIFOXYC1_FULL_54_43]|nr:MAG: 50S ribosomal protein L31 [Bdellovibrionales bacterium RIFOXYC1_FULL_54_43]OFZ83223.1 MAG: 50S ribosomal protein L31 [Bdellovibrionales bacterium RIFOXYD1_FULL_55_31]HLD99130.1 50S ribosomal protein L31 [Bdellovibrionota bacterium]